MDPISAFILTKAAEAFVSTLANSGTEALIAKLKGDPQIGIKQPISVYT